MELLSPETLAGVLQWSDQPHGSPWVHRQAMGFLAEEFSALAASPLLYQLSKTQLLQLLQSDFLQVIFPLSIPLPLLTALESIQLEAQYFSRSTAFHGRHCL